MGQVRTNKDLIDHLKGKARQIKVELLKLAAHTEEGHCPSALSIADIVAVLYFHHMRHDPGNPNWGERDRFILSKGHGCLALYSALHCCGYFDRNKLYTFLEPGSGLPGHPLLKGAPGVEASTGSLGHGMSISVGMAMAARMDRQAHRICCIVGDGECNEGIVWEAAMLAAHHKLDNLLCIVDRNNYQCDGFAENILNMGAMDEKWQSFGWEARVCDGHSIKDLVDVLDQVPFVKGRPSVVVASTVKGKGVDFMESSAEWHYRAPRGDEVAEALRQIQEGSGRG